MYNAMHDTNKSVLAHVSPSEVKEFSELEKLLGLNSDQNGNYKMKFKKGGVPDFSALDKLFSHPEVERQTTIFLKKKMKTGGKAVIDDYGVMKKSGRFGDTKMAHLPHSLAKTLDKLYGKSVNPKTGKREYFIGALLGGLSRMLPTILPMLGGMFGGGSSGGAPQGGMMQPQGQSGGGFGGMLSNIMGALSNPATGAMMQNLGSIQQMAAPLMSMFGGGQQQQQMPQYNGGYNGGMGGGQQQQQMPQYSGGYNGGMGGYRQIMNYQPYDDPHGAPYGQFRQQPMMQQQIPYNQYSNQNMGQGMQQDAMMQPQSQFTKGYIPRTQTRQWGQPAQTAQSFNTSMQANPFQKNMR